MSGHCNNDLTCDIQTTIELSVTETEFILSLFVLTYKFLHLGCLFLVISYNYSILLLIKL